MDNNMDLDHRTSLLSLPDELLIPILSQCIDAVRPQAAIRFEIVRLGRTCVRFHRVLNSFLDSTVNIGLTIPATRFDPVAVSYRLCKYNTKGAAGPFVRHLEIYGGARTPFSAYTASINMDQTTHRTLRRPTTQNASSIVLHDYFTRLNSILPSLQNLTSASLQNTRESLFVHLIPAIQGVLTHCTHLRAIKLFLNFTVETNEEWESTLFNLEEKEGIARLKELDIFITHIIQPSSRTPEGVKPREYTVPMQVLSTVLGDSVKSVRKLEFTYDINGLVADYKSVKDLVMKKMVLPELRELRYAGTSVSTIGILKDFFEIAYEGVEKIGFNGFGMTHLRSKPTVDQVFASQMFKTQYLSIDAGGENKEWIYDILTEGFLEQRFPMLRTIEIRVTKHEWDALMGTGTMFKVPAEIQFGTAMLGLKKKYKWEQKREGQWRNLVLAVKS